MRRASTSTAKNVAQREPERRGSTGARNRGDYAPGTFGELAEAYTESIRRSVRTGLSGLSVDASHRVGSDIAERMLGHVIRGVRGI